VLAKSHGETIGEYIGVIGAGGRWISLTHADVGIELIDRESRLVFAAAARSG
jgi:hypothetical protein